MARPLVLLLAIAALVVAGCGGGDDDAEDGTATEGAPAAEATTEEPKAAKTGATIKTGDSQFGQILFDGDDRAIYLFTKESGPRSECYGACAEAWPPVLSDGQPRAGSGAMTSLLGTTKRNDGSTQVTYNGHPLYYYVDDPVGEALCHDVEEFGGIWYVVQPNGNAVQ